MNCGAVCALALTWTLTLLLLLRIVDGNHDAKRLYDDLLRSKNYNKLVRPVSNNTATLTVRLGLRLSQLINVDEKNEIITLNMWVIQEWYDSNLNWDPRAYGGVSMLYVPAESIWLPDIVLYNNADGDYNITLMTKAMLTYTGKVSWEPPAIYKSHCDINVKFFPFDQQDCHLKFGSWSYDGFQVDVRHVSEEKYVKNETDLIEKGMEMDDYYPSHEWDVMGAKAQKHIVKYPCCPEPFPDITFNITLRRKTLFYTVNLIIPCVSINLLTMLGFYLPSDCGEKISLCISILLSLSIFQLFLMDIVPATSITIPLLGNYLLFTSTLVSLSIFASVLTLNVNFRSTATQKMPRLTRKLFLEILPRLLFMKKPMDDDEDEVFEVDSEFTDRHRDPSDYQNPYKRRFTPLQTHDTPSRESGYGVPSTFVGLEGNFDLSNFCDACAQRRSRRYPPNVHKSFDGASFIVKHLQQEDDSRRTKDEWKCVALVIDRLLLWVYASMCFVGAMAILLNAPALYDRHQPINEGVSD